MEIKATGLPKTIEDYQVALNAAFAGGKAYGLAQRTWVGLMRGVRVEGDTVVISVKGGNDAARELCGELINEINK